MTGSSKSASEMTPAEFEKALQAADAQMPRAPKSTDCGKPYNPSNFSGQGQSFGEFLSSLDDATIKATGNSELIRMMHDRKSEEVAEEFLRLNADLYVATDENFELIVRDCCKRVLGKTPATVDDGEEMLLASDSWTTVNLTQSFKRLLALGKMTVPRGKTKVLSADELKEVAVAISTDGEDTAVLQHLSFQLMGLPDDLESPRDLLVKYSTEATAAAMFVFAHTCSDFEDTAAWRAFLKSRTAHRYGVLGVQQLREIWNLFRFQGNDSVPASTTAPAQAAQPDFTNMSDAEIATLHEQTSRLARIRRDSGKSWQPEPPQF